MSFGSKLACGVAAVALAGLMWPAHAQDADESWFYVGAAAGQVEYSQDEGYYAPFRKFSGMSGVDLESSTRTERFHVGYRANRYLAFDLGYADLGTSEQVTFCPNICPPEDHGPSTSSARRADLTINVIRPIGDRFEVMAKLGVARTRHETPWEMGAPHTDVEYFTGRIIGAGVRFFVTPSWALRLDYDRSEVPAAIVNHHPAEKRIDSFWLGFEYGFR